MKIITYRNIGGIYTACFRWARTFGLFNFYGKLYGLFKDNIHYCQFKGVSTRENSDPVIFKHCNKLLRHSNVDIIFPTMGLMSGQNPFPHNVASISFAPREIMEEIIRFIAGFETS